MPSDRRGILASQLLAFKYRSLQPQPLEFKDTDEDTIRFKHGNHGMMYQVKKNTSDDFKTIFDSYTRIKSIGYDQSTGNYKFRVCGFLKEEIKKPRVFYVNRVLELNDLPGAKLIVTDAKKEVHTFTQVNQGFEYKLTGDLKYVSQDAKHTKITVKDNKITVHLRDFSYDVNEPITVTFMASSDDCEKALTFQQRCKAVAAKLA